MLVPAGGNSDLPVHPASIEHISFLTLEKKQTNSSQNQANDHSKSSTAETLAAAGAKEKVEQTKHCIHHHILKLEGLLLLKKQV